MSVAKEFEAANAKYAASFTKGGLQLPPQHKVAIVACMDARLDTARALGLEEDDAHVIRNAGGRQLLGTREVVIVHHTDCGMLTFTDENADHIVFLPFADLKQSVLEDVKLVKESPLILDVPVTGYIYEVESGKIVKVE
ncbi:carbonic anhydrase [Aspergillus venezuelensis]